MKEKWVKNLIKILKDIDDLKWLWFVIDSIELDKQSIKDLQLAFIDAWDVFVWFVYWVKVSVWDFNLIKLEY